MWRCSWCCLYADTQAREGRSQTGKGRTLTLLGEESSGPSPNRPEAEGGVFGDASSEVQPEPVSQASPVPVLQSNPEPAAAPEPTPEFRAIPLRRKGDALSSAARDRGRLASGLRTM